MTVLELLAQWRTQADTLRPYNGGAAFAYEQAARELEGVMAAIDADVLTLEEASKASNYSVDHLRHLVSAGQIPNAGKRGAPRIARKDLPKRAGRVTSSAYNPTEDALRLVAGSRSG